MGGNSFGTVFRITTYGESHGPGMGVVIDGCPAGVTIDVAFLQAELTRRRPGQSNLVSARNEPDHAIIQSGVFEGRSTGTPLHIFIPNEDQRSSDYSHIQDKYRPSHADYTYDYKYGIRDYRGGGRSSARETTARVAAGAIAKIILQELGVNITAFVSQVGQVEMPLDMYEHVTHDAVEANAVRCPHPETASQIESLIQDLQKDGDTIGGKITCIIKGCPPGLGEPVFDKLHADLGKAMLSINAVKGFEFGSGFSCITMRGSEHNDIFLQEKGSIKTSSNYSGGIQGGISNGMDISFNVAFKPVATIMQEQATIDKEGKAVTLEGKGRHDPCVVPRAVPIVEAMAALVLVDHFLRARTNKI